MDGITALVVVILLWFLLGQHFAAYPFTLFSYGQSEPNPAPDSGEIAGYWIIASVILALMFFGFIVGASQDRMPALVMYPIFGALVLAIVIVFAVPAFDWNPDPVYPVNPNYCSRTDSENCPGG